MQRIQKTGFLLLLCCFSFLSVFSQSTIPQNNLTVLTGTISNENGAMISGASVTIPKLSLGTVSGENGTYKISSKFSGSYLIKISYLGYKTVEKQINFNKGETVHLDISLSMNAQNLATVVVSTKTRARQIEETAFNVDVQKTKKLANTTQSTAEALNRVSGIRVRQTGGVGSDMSISLNGFTGNQVKIFIDGVPMSNYGPSFQLNNIPVGLIKRIEVYKGVVPIRLGADALGGAINIVTKKRLESYAGLSYSYGSFNTHQALANATYINQETGFTVRGNLNYTYSDNNYDVKVKVKQDKLGNKEVVKTVPRFHDRYRSATAKAELGWVNRDFADQLLFGVVVSGEDDQVQNGSTMNSVYGGITQNSRSVIATLKYQKENLFTEHLNLNFSASYNYVETRTVDTLQGVVFNWAGERFYTPGDNTGETGSKPFDQSQYDNGVNSQLNIDYKINDKHSVALNHAFDYFHRKTFDRRDPDKIVNQFPKSLFKNILGLSYKYQPNSKWSAILFGKAYFMTAKSSKREGFGQESTRKFKVDKQNLGYGAALSYFPLSRLQLKASYEHTYRLPLPTEIFGNGLFVQPNPELKPEESDNFNLGIDYRFDINEKHQFQVGGSFIYRQSNNLIFQVVTLSSPQTSFENLAKVRTTGFEGHFNYSFNKFHIGGNITYQNITDQAERVYNDYAGYQKNFHQGERLPNRPYLFGNLHASYQFNNVIFDNSQLRINYYFHFVEEYYLSWAGLGRRNTKTIIPSQATHDLELIYSLENGKYNIALECSNLTDELVYDKFYLQRPGRAFYLKLRYVF